MAMDFTKPWLRGKKVIPRKGKEPPRLEPIIKVVPLKDDDGKAVVPKVVHGAPGRVDPWIEAEIVKNKSDAKADKK
jgi:hypothetical protein